MQNMHSAYRATLTYAIVASGRDQTMMMAHSKQRSTRQRVYAMRDGRTHLDEHAGLIVRVRGEHLILLGGDGGVAGDE